MQCRTHNRPQCCSITTAQPAVNLWSQDSGSRSAWRSSIPYGIDLHTRTHRERYVRTGRHCLFPGHVSMLSMPLPCLSLPRSCPSAQRHAHPGVPCHAMPCHADAMPCPAAPMPQPGRAQSSQSSIDISSVSCPALPTIGSQTRLHLGFRTSPNQVSCALPSCPVLSCKVGAQPALPACQSASLPISACLSTSSLCVMPDSIRFVCFCFAFQCFALPCWPLLA